MKTESNPLKKLLLVLAGVLALAALPLAHAVPTLKISDGSNTLTINDLTYADLNPAAGAVTYSGAFGGFLINVMTGISSAGILTLDSVNISTGAAGGPLEISLSDNFSGPTYSEVTASIYGTTPGSVLYSVYANGNELFGPGSFGTTVGGFTLPANYTLTQKVVISPGLGVTNLYARVAVPDGGSTVALLGAALVGLAGLRRKFRGVLKVV